jgi:hypothetical protein
MARFTKVFTVLLCLFQFCQPRQHPILITKGGRLSHMNLHSLFTLTPLHLVPQVRQETHSVLSHRGTTRLTTSLGFDGNRNWNPNGFEFSDDQRSRHPVRLIGRSDSARPLLDNGLVNAVCPRLNGTILATR